MQEPETECRTAGIPRRLHKNYRPVCEVPSGDWLYLWHPASTGSYGFEIFGKFRVESQSFNSHALNEPDGNPRDVLYDTETGRHRLELQIARVGVDDIRSLDIPNDNTVVKDAMGKIIEYRDRYRFEVVHKPTPCMYPHCQLVTLKNGQQKPVNSSDMKTAIREAFAELAERHREEMSATYPPGGPLQEHRGNQRNDDSAVVAGEASIDGHSPSPLWRFLLALAKRAVSRFARIVRFK